MHYTSFEKGPHFNSTCMISRLAFTIDTNWGPESKAGVYESFKDFRLGKWV